MTDAAAVAPALQRYVQTQPEQQKSEQRSADDADGHAFPQGLAAQ
jgi:hypothetical protein